MDLFDRAVHGPVRKRKVLPAAQAPSLKVLPDRDGQERAQPIVDGLAQSAFSEPGQSLPTAELIAFMKEIFDDLVRIQCESNRPILVGAAVGEDIMQRTGDLPTPES